MVWPVQSLLWRNTQGSFERSASRWCMTLSIEAKYNQILDENAFLTRTIKQLKLALHQMQIDKAATERANTLSEAMLPQSSIDRLNEAFATSTDNAGLKQAINAEWRYVRSMNKQDVRVQRILGE
jgi:hypothetical protein